MDSESSVSLRHFFFFKISKNPIKKHLMVVSMIKVFFSQRVILCGHKKHNEDFLKALSYLFILLCAKMLWTKQSALKKRQENKNKI